MLHTAWPLAAERNQNGASFHKVLTGQETRGEQLEESGESSWAGRLSCLYNMGGVYVQ